MLPLTEALKPTPFRHAEHHVVEQRSAQAVHGLSLAVVTITAYLKAVFLLRDIGPLGHIHLQLALGSLHGDVVVCDGHLHLVWHLN